MSEAGRSQWGYRNRREKACHDVVGFAGVAITIAALLCWIFSMLPSLFASCISTTRRNFHLAPRSNPRILEEFDTHLIASAKHLRRSPLHQHS